MDEKPQYLYHYTRIDNLAMILKNKSMLMRPLTSLDDLEEGDTVTKKNWAKYCYVSCWTSEDRESIPMWKMYCPSTGGIRIRMPSDMAQYKNLFDSDIGKLMRIIEFYEPNISEENAKIKAEDRVRSSKVKIDTNGLPADEIQLYKVEYSDRPNKIYPKFIKFSNKKDMIVSPYRLGRVKRNIWRFQKEWRFAITYLPISIFDSDPIHSTYASYLLNQQLFPCPELPFDSIEMKIKPSAMNELEITMHPHATEGEIELVNLLRDRYVPEALICESGLKNILKK